MLKRCSLLRGIRFCSTKSTHPSQYIISKVKQYDYETYLTLLLSPKQWRYPAFVLHAFNTELSLAADSVTDRRTATGRFTFWSVALDRIFENKKSYEHPVLLELQKLHQHQVITDEARHYLTQLIEAREQLALTPYLSTYSQLKSYSQKTKSALNHLLLQVAGVRGQPAESAADSLGLCQGIVTALRATPYLASQNQILLPQDILAQFKVSQQDVLRATEKLRSPVKHLAYLAEEDLKQTKEEIKSLKRPDRLVFLPVTIAQRVLTSLGKCDYNLGDPKLHRKDSLLPLRLWIASKVL